MTLAASETAPISSEEVCRAFVDKYYAYLCQAPESLHAFYKDSSTMSHQDCNGSMTSAATVKDIHDCIMSDDYKGCAIEIQSEDSQWSKEGLLILVIGFLTKKDGVRCKFSQSFFLAHQEPHSFFIINDILKTFGDNQSIHHHNDLTIEAVSDNQSIQHHNNPIIEAVEQDDAPAAPLVPVSCCSTSDTPAEKTLDLSVNASHSDPASTPEDSALATKNAPKSFAELVKDLAKVGLTTPVIKPATELTNVAALPKRAPEAEAVVSTSNRGLQNTSPEEGFSIYIKNLPLNTTVDQIDKELKRFGTIKPGGIQIRKHKIEPCSFAFLEFESESSTVAAIKSSPLVIGGRQVHIQEKRGRTIVANSINTSISSGRFASNQGFASNGIRNRGESTGQFQGPAGHSGEVHQQRPPHNSNKKSISRSGSSNGTN